MLKIENFEVVGWDHAIRGMRNPMNSWEKSDSYATYIEDSDTAETAPFEFFVGLNDQKLMESLAKVSVRSIRKLGLNLTRINPRKTPEKTSDITQSKDVLRPLTESLSTLKNVQENIVMDKRRKTL